MNKSFDEIMNDMHLREETRQETRKESQFKIDHLIEENSRKELINKVAKRTIREQSDKIYDLVHAARKKERQYREALVKIHNLELRNRILQNKLQSQYTIEGEDDTCSCFID